MANLERADLMAIGKHCYKKDCRQIDFLPFNCQRCRHDYWYVDFFPGGFLPEAVFVKGKNSPKNLKIIGWEKLKHADGFYVECCSSMLNMVR